MSQILLDVTRLLSRFYDGLLHTDVDRVGLAYGQRYGADARAVLREQGFSAILYESDSQAMFALFFSARRDRLEIRNRLIGSIARGQFRQKMIDSAFLLHTSHNGMELPRYCNAMKKHGIKTV